eukprot:354314-Chlamydomonas_euryale.AAC.17
MSLRMCRGWHLQCPLPSRGTSIAGSLASSNQLACFAGMFIWVVRHPVAYLMGVWMHQGHQAAHTTQAATTAVR